MKAPPLALAVLLTTGQALVTENGLSAMPLGGVARPTAIDSSASIILEVQGAGRLDRLWQHRSILEQALQASPEEPPVLPRVRPAQQPAPQAEHPAIPLESEAASAPEQLAEAPAGFVSCEEAAAIVAEYGFSAIHPTACSGGDVYRFSASRDGTAYSISVAAAGGEITDVSRE